MADHDDTPPDLPPPAVIKGRGAARNIAHRFSTDARESVHDGWYEENATPSPRTVLLEDQAKSVLSYNQSPDLAFDRAVNPYRGCEHGCIYCYARPTHAWLGLSPGLDFETRLFHKPDAVAVLRQELAAPGYVCAPIALGSATDAYQPVERGTGLSRQILTLLRDTRHPVSIITKNALIVRDLDLLGEMAGDRLVHVAFSITTLQNDLARQLEPRASRPAARLAAMEKLAAAGIPVSIFVAPLIPGLNDHELEKLLAAGHAHGARHAEYILLRLPHEVHPLFRQWLDAHAPEKAARIMSVLYDLRQGRANDSQFGSRMSGLGHFADLIRQRFTLACRRLGLDPQGPVLACDRFRPPVVEKKKEKRQLDLF